MEFLTLVSSICSMLSCISFYLVLLQIFFPSQKMLVMCFLEKSYIWNGLTPAWLEAGDWQLASSFADRHLGPGQIPGWAWISNMSSLKKRPGVLGCVVGGSGCYMLACVALNLLLGFHPSQFEEHIDRQEGGWVKATEMARPEVLLWWEAEEMGLLPGKGMGRPNGYLPKSVGQSLRLYSLWWWKIFRFLGDYLTAREQETWV